MDDTLFILSVTFGGMILLTVCCFVVVALYVGIIRLLEHLEIISTEDADALL